MKILVAGGAGFLGLNLVDHLLKEGQHVVLLDAFVNGLESTITHLVGHPRLTLLRHNIQDPLPGDLVVHQIYHLACPASPKQYQRDPVQTLRTCYNGTENLLQFALRCNARILFSSTSEIYGEPLVSPQSESYFGNVNTYGPRSCYDEGKRVGEALCFAYQETFQVDVRIARIFNAYGPGMPASDGRVVSNFIAAALSGQPINITGDGSATRCFQYVTDCISGLIKLMAGDYCKPVNIGNDIPCRIDQLANLVAELVAKNADANFQTMITYSKKRINDPVTRQPDISLAKELLDWRPVVSLEEGLQKTIDWFRSPFSSVQTPMTPESNSNGVTEQSNRETVGPVPFNIPPIVGSELRNMEIAMAATKLSGGGAFTKKCQNWLQQRLCCGSVTLTSSGTSALEMAAQTLNIRPGDEIIMPSYTFVSTANAFALRGATIVFVDVRPDTMNMDESLIEAAITENTKAIVPVHYAGIACEMDTIMNLAARFQIKVVEDAAQGLLSTYKGRALGSIGHIGCLSFHESKNVTSGGQGGAVLINDKSLMARAEIIAEKGTDRGEYLRGARDSYTWRDIGSSFSMSEIQAAYLWSQLEAVESLTARRLVMWNRYQQHLQPLAKKDQLTLPAVQEGSQHNAHIYYIRLLGTEQRETFMAYMKSKGIGTSSHYSPLHACIPARKFGRFAGEDKFTTQQSEKLVRLPIFDTMSEGMQDMVVGAIRNFLLSRV